MHQVEFDPFNDDASEMADPERDIDLDEDQVDVRDEGDRDGAVEDEYRDDQERKIENADLDNVLDEFVDLVNARDLDALSELMEANVEAEFLGGTSRAEVLEALGDLFMRYPHLLTTRADLGTEPIVAVWTFDHEADRFDQFGFLFLEMSEATEGLVDRISYTAELPDSDDLVIETPERADLPEWEDWSELDED